MRFSTLTILSFVASTSAFVPVANRPNVVSPFATRQSKTPLFSLSDLEAKLLTPEPPKKPVVTTKPDPKTKAAPAPKVEKPKPKPAPVPAKPAPVVTAKKAPKVTTTAYNLDTGIAQPPKKVAPSMIKFEKPKPPPVSLPKAPKAPKAPVVADDNAGLGVLVGGAPLVLVPLAALAAGRDLLTKTAARRAEIQKEIADFEASQAKKKRLANADAGGITKAAGFLGVAGAALALIIAAPFAGFDGPSGSSVPTATTPPAITRPAKAVKVTKSKLDKSGYNLDTTATPEEKVSADKSVAAEKEADKKAAAEKAAAAKEEAIKAEKEAKAKEAAEKAAAAEAKAKEEKAAKEAKAAAEADKKATKDASAKEAAAVADSKAADAEADKKAAEDKEAQAKEAAIKAEKIVKEKEAAEKKAEQEATAKASAAAKAEAQVAVDVKKVAAPKPAPAPAPTPIPAPAPAAVKGGGVGVVVGSESGGKVLPKEEVSDDVKNFLKKYNK